MKRTILWSTGASISAFKIYSTMKRKDFRFDGSAKTAEKYLNSRGEVAYKGTRALKGTQYPGSFGFCFVVSNLSFHMGSKKNVCSVGPNSKINQGSTCLALLALW